MKFVYGNIFEFKKQNCWLFPETLLAMNLLTPSLLKSTTDKCFTQNVLLQPREALSVMCISKLTVNILKGKTKKVADSQQAIFLLPNIGPSLNYIYIINIYKFYHL